MLNVTRSCVTNKMFANAAISLLYSQKSSVLSVVLWPGMWQLPARAAPPFNFWLVQKMSGNLLDKKLLSNNATFEGNPHLKWRHCMLYWNYHTLHIIQVKIVSWQIWVYNSDFLPRLVVIIVVIRCRLRDITDCRLTLLSCTVACRRHHTSSSRVVIVYCLYGFCHVLRSSSCVLAHRCRFILPLCAVVVKWQTRPFFLPRRIRDQELGYCLGLCKVWTVKKFTAAVDCRL